MRKWLSRAILRLWERMLTKQLEQAKREYRARREWWLKY
jgi:hypothetical protein